MHLNTPFSCVYVLISINICPILITDYFVLPNEMKQIVVASTVNINIIVVLLEKHCINFIKLNS